MARNVVITGCNRGIGLELAKLYHAQGDQVIALVRESSAELSEVATQIIDNYDVTNDDAPGKLNDQLPEIDVLINNAGLFENETLPFAAQDWDQMRRQFEVNTLGPLKLSSALIDKMKPGSLMAFTTSRMGSIADNTSGGYYGYRMSKAALNMGVKSLAVDLKSRSIATVLLHPGYVKTRMTQFQGEITPEESARGLFKILNGMNLEKTGTFWHTNSEALSW